jgi:hypothetical protein
VSEAQRDVVVSYVVDGEQLWAMPPDESTPRVDARALRQAADLLDEKADRTENAIRADALRDAAHEAEVWAEDDDDRQAIADWLNDRADALTAQPADRAGNAEEGT